MKAYLKKLLVGNMLVYFIYIVFGVFLIRKPGLSLNLISFSLGLIIVLSSLLAIIKFISDNTKEKFFRLELLYGILGLVLGALIIFEPFGLRNFFIVGFGIYLLFEGVMKLWYGIYFRRLKEEIWSLHFGMGLVFLLLGILLIVNPFAGVMIFTKVLGIFVIGGALLNIMASMLFYKRIKEIIKLIY